MVQLMAECPRGQPLTGYLKFFSIPVKGTDGDKVRACNNAVDARER